LAYDAPMTRCVAVLLLMCITPAVSQAPNHILVFWRTDYQPITGTLPRGVMVWVQDESAETTDFRITVEYRDSHNEPQRVEGGVNKVYYNGSSNIWTPLLLRADNIFVVDRVTAVAMKITGWVSTDREIWSASPAPIEPEPPSGISQPYIRNQRHSVSR
jgi:hypothetical protein